ncbi:hydroxymethylglutaryl-CoA lyase [Shouchella shacheensis]|uniref:hydroxymethylglutaryl-CoA lyase n=1 Tax=Shouchella shacheensis TaxID=1649580 RepID=UPI00073FAAB4|nr:hydroxymethylglutaryl-CoA lyase [Shouchella shacheensis]
MPTDSLPKQVEIWEVAPRDGFQAEETWIPTETKLEIIRELASTGLKSMEITSFVHPKAIPQLKDADEVVSQAGDLNLKLRALVPNVRGAERAINVGIKKLKLMLSATDSHSLSNANATARDAQQKLWPIADLAAKHGVSVGGSVSVAFGCPYEGKVPLERIAAILTRYQEMDVHEVSLADTTGMANPVQVSQMLRYLNQEFPEMRFSLHLHNTRGMALANAVAALQEGVLDFDSSIAGLGGCPYAPGASGNIASEDLVHAFHEMGVDTGANLERLIEVAKNVRDRIGHDGGSYMLQAGPNSALHQKPVSQSKLG